MKSLPAITAKSVLSKRNALLESVAPSHLRRCSPTDLSELAYNLLQAGLATVVEPVIQRLQRSSSSVPDIASRHSPLVLLARSLYDTHQWDQLFALIEANVHALPAEDAAIKSQLLMRGAWAALRVGNLEGAQAYCDAAARACEYVPMGCAQGDIQFFRAWRAANSERDLVGATSQMHSTVVLFRELADPFYLTRALITTAGLELRIGNFAAAYLLSCEALEVAADAGNVAEAVGALALVAVICYRQGRPALGLEFIERARSLLGDGEAHRRTAQLDLAECRIRLMMDDPDGCVELLSRVTQWLELAPDGQLEAVCHEFAGMLAIVRGHPQEALEHLDRSLAVLREMRDASYFTAEALGWKATAACALGMHEQASRWVEDGLAIVEATGERLDRGLLLHVRAQAARGSGDLPLALELLESAEFELRALGDLHQLGCVLLTRSELAAADPEHAAAAAAEAVEIFKQCGSVELAVRARSVLASTGVDRASRERSDGDRGSLGPPLGIIAASPPMRALLTEVRKIASSRGAVLVTGETGVGKEIIARAIHDSSKPKRREFVPVNCAAIPETLFEREFFGHAKGAYTGADQDRPGLVELADGGTLFLDEVGELPAAMQAKLLRLLQDGTYRRVGDAGERTVALRIVAATNRDLSRQVAEHRFREDLYYRLRIFEIEVPPLRERPEDIAPLAKLFLERESASLGTELWLEKAAWAALKSFPWPRNVRELEAAVLSATARADRTGCIRLEHLPRNVRQAAPMEAVAAMDLARHLEIEERRMIQLALDRAKQSKAEAARYLGISRNTLYDKMKRLGIEG